MSWQTTAILDDFALGCSDCSHSIDMTATAYVERDEIWDGRCRTVEYGDQHVISTPVFSADLHILSDEANRAYAEWLSAMYAANERFRNWVDSEIEAQAEREIEGRAA